MAFKHVGQAHAFAVHVGSSRAGEIADHRYAVQKEQDCVRPRDVVRATLSDIKKADIAKDLLDELATRGEGQWREGPVKPSGQKGPELFFLN